MITSTNKREKIQIFILTHLVLTCTTIVEKLRSQKVCRCATPPSLPHSCINILPHIGDFLSLALFVSVGGLAFAFFFFFSLLL